jgi:galacturan 1,4-alpha-galacturonidase
MDRKFLTFHICNPMYTHNDPQLSDDLPYWRTNSYPISFQNHAAAFILTGSNIHLDGYGTGGIHGNGEAWYNAEKADTQPGRPMPFVPWNITKSSVKNFFVKQPPLWAVNVMNGTDLVFDNIYVNATASQAPWGKNWVQNTDGFGAFVLILNLPRSLLYFFLRTEY